MGRRPPADPEDQCEYRRCGGTTGREVKRPRQAWTRVKVADRYLKVCESCAHQLHRSRRASGERATGPEILEDILSRMLLPTNAGRTARPTG